MNGSVRFVHITVAPRFGVSVFGLQRVLPPKRALGRSVAKVAIVCGKDADVAVLEVSKVGLDHAPAEVVNVSVDGFPQLLPR